MYQSRTAGVSGAMEAADVVWTPCAERPGLKSRRIVAIYGPGLRVTTMAVGWAKDGAVQEQIDASIEDALKDVRGRMPKGQSLKYCAECGVEIPQARRAAVPGVRLCIACQAEADKHIQVHSLYNRRGSKDSQLR